MSSFGVHPDLHLASSAAFFFRRRLLKIRLQHCTRRMIDAASDQQGPYGARKLLANSTAMSLTARLCSMVRIQSGAFEPRLPSLMIEVAPTIKCVRSCRFSGFDTAPSLSFPPLDCALGVNPSKPQNAVQSQNRGHSRLLSERQRRYQCLLRALIALNSLVENRP